MLSSSARHRNVVPLTNVVQLTPPPRAALVAPGTGVDREGLARLQRERARLRRRNVLLALVALSVVTLVAAISVGSGFAVVMHLLCDALLVSYVGALALRQRRILERYAKVTEVAPARVAANLAGSRGYLLREDAPVGYMASAPGHR